MSAFRPSVGQVALFVYRECACGSWCLTGEGAFPPLCGGCGRRMMPLGTAKMDDGRPRFGSDFQEQRRIRGLGVVGLFTNEIAASGLLGKFRKMLGLFDAETHQTFYGYHREPYAAEREIEMSLPPDCPKDRVWEGKPPWEQPHVLSDSDDGRVARGEWLIPHTSEAEPFDPHKKAPVA